LIRRVIWLAVGAILGIVGYRRVERLVRAISPQRLATPAWWQVGRAQRRVGAGHKIGRQLASGDPPAGAGAFLSDVRDGMAEYLARHSGRSGNTLICQQARSGLRAIPGSDNPKDGR
jgi:hypothetical protein